ncbi:MAG: hypothetical protein JSS86_04235, partial [Cyanobacteria bacterium SZAS LIN-2]|nr:hypothetical protein [Cyanobacteria bacterium SZAS LIN-2]
SELESTVLKEQTDLTTVSHSGGSSVTGSATGKKTVITTGDDTVPRNDGAYFGGLALIFAGVVLVFQHVKVSSGLLNMLGLGSGGFALLFLPLMVGIGMMFYDNKNKWGWIVTALSCVLLIFSFLATLVINFPPLTMAQMVIMFLPFAIGGALLIKGLGGKKGVEQAIKANLTKKEG